MTALQNLTAFTVFVTVCTAIVVRAVWIWCGE